MVLPHAKRQNEDLVVFVDAKWTAGAAARQLGAGTGDAAGAEAAEQVAAVVALHHVAGDRQYHLLLPKPFLPLWQELGKVSAAPLGTSHASLAPGSERSLREHPEDEVVRAFHQGLAPPLRARSAAPSTLRPVAARLALPCDDATLPQPDPSLPAPSAACPPCRRPTRSARSRRRSGATATGSTPSTRPSASAARPRRARRRSS